MTKTLENLKTNIKEPWYWVITTLFLTPILPIYITPIFSIGIFIALLVKNKRENNKFFIGKMGGFIIAYCVFMFIGVTYSKTKSVSLCMALLWTFLALGFFATVSLIDSREKFITALKAVTLGSVVTGFVAIMQYLAFTFKFYFPDPFWAPIDKVALGLLNHLGFHFIVRFDAAIQYRQSSTFMNQNVYGVFLLLVIPMVGILAIIAKSRRWRIVSYISLVVLLAGLLASESRGCYISMIIAIVLFVILARNKLLMSIIPISIIGALLVPQVYVNRLLSLLKYDHSMQLRVRIWKVALTTIRHNFFIGLGPGVQNFWNILKATANINLPHAHNLILQVFVEGGVIGFLIASGIFGVFVVEQVRFYKSAENQNGKFKLLNGEMKLYNNPQMCNRIIATGFICMMVAFISQGMTDYVFLDPKVVQYFMLVMGLTVAIYRIHNREKLISK